MKDEWYFISIIPATLFCGFLSYGGGWFAFFQTTWFGLWALLGFYIINETNKELKGRKE